MDSPRRPSDPVTQILVCLIAYLALLVGVGFRLNNQIEKNLRAYNNGTKDLRNAQFLSKYAPPSYTTFDGQMLVISTSTASAATIWEISVTDPRPRLTLTSTIPQRRAPTPEQRPKP